MVDVIRRGCLKTHSPENARKNFAIGTATNDFLGFPRHFQSPKFRLFRRKWTFSTPTPDYVNCDGRLYFALSVGTLSYVASDFILTSRHSRITMSLLKPPSRSENSFAARSSAEASCPSRIQ